MPTNKRITLHPLNKQGQPDTNTNLFPKTFSNALLKEDGVTEFVPQEELSSANAGSNITITKEEGVVKISSSGGTPSNMVTIDTDQTITGHKVFDVTFGTKTENNYQTAAFDWYNNISELYLRSLSDDVEHPSNARAYYMCHRIQLEDMLNDTEFQVNPSDISSRHIRFKGNGFSAVQDYRFPEKSGTFSLTSDLLYLTEAPTYDNETGMIKIVVLNEEPATKYEGYIYIILDNGALL